MGTKKVLQSFKYIYINYWNRSWGTSGASAIKTRTGVIKAKTGLGIGAWEKAYKIGAKESLLLVGALKKILAGILITRLTDKKLQKGLLDGNYVGDESLKLF